jgi:hypothetical protein
MEEFRMKPIDRKTFLQNRKWRWIAGIALILVVIRAALPFFIEWRINGILAGLDGPFCGQVEDIDLALIIGRVQLEGLDLNGRLPGEKKCDEDILSVKRANGTISWSQLFRGRLRLKIAVHDPRLNADGLMKIAKSSDPKKPSTQPGLAALRIWNRTVPWRIDSFDLYGGRVYLPLVGKKGISEPMEDLELHVAGIEAGRNSALPARFHARGKVLSGGEFLSSGTIALNEAPIRWDLNFTAQKIDMTKANPMLLNRVPLTFTRGSLELYAEAAGDLDSFGGYVKPFFTDVDVVSSNEEWLGTKHALIEIINGLFFSVAERPKNETVATVVAFEKTPTGMEFDAVGALFRAASHRLGNQVRRGLEESVRLPDAGAGAGQVGKEPGGEEL